MRSSLPFLLALTATSALAQAAPPTPAVPDVNALVAQAKELARQWQWQDFSLAELDPQLAGLPPSMAFIASEFGQPREIVKNAPYTAEAVTESIQVLPDGNRIVRKSTSLLARDTQGRTRQERTGEGRGGVVIHDPMEGRSMVLNERSRTVTRVPQMPALPAPPEPPVPPVPPASSGKDVEVQPGRVVVKRRGAGAPDDIHVEVVRIARGEHDAALPPAPPLPPLTLPIVPRGKGETKSLGTREFEGLKAEGTLTTHTIPAGQIGNEKPIAITSERWFSPDLFVVVYAKTSDPRAGETTYRLTNVRRGEPPADLFKVPADYRARGEGRRS
jgi:hypothetical protein